jgi:hypothetical protein
LGCFEAVQGGSSNSKVFDHFAPAPFIEVRGIQPLSGTYFVWIGMSGNGLQAASALMEAKKVRYGLSL